MNVPNAKEARVRTFTQVERIVSNEIDYAIREGKTSITINSSKVKVDLILEKIKMLGYETDSNISTGYVKIFW